MAGGVGVLARSGPRWRTDSCNEGAVSRMKPHFAWLNLPSCARSASDFPSPVRMATALAPRGVRPVVELGAARSMPACRACRHAPGGRAGVHGAPSSRGPDAVSLKMPSTSKPPRSAKAVSSTVDQSCERQLRDLGGFAERAGFEVVATFSETASGAKDSRRERRRVMELAQARRIDAVLVNEFSRWERSTQDLLDTLYRLAGWQVSVVAMSGMTFELGTPHGRMIATILAGIAQFERDLISERVKSGLAAAKARGRKLGRQPGQRPKSDRLAPRVLRLVGEGWSYRWIARDLGISKNTVGNIVKRERASA